MKTISFLLLLMIPFEHYQAQVMTAEEGRLYDLIMEYRKSRKLTVIPKSPSLTIVAHTHVLDLATNQPDKGQCNLHSWSAKGTWSPCCYTSDHGKASCMWKKPSELTDYKGNGYEISAWSSESITPEQALSMWKGSPGHNACVINSGMWKEPWQAIGVGIHDGYAVVWFGNEPDPLSDKAVK